jgi:hypothetical protein
MTTKRIIVSLARSLCAALIASLAGKKMIICGGAFLA